MKELNWVGGHSHPAQTPAALISAVSVALGLRCPERHNTIAAF
jgi:hypothetical protein